MRKASRISQIKEGDKYTTEAMGKALTATDGRVYEAAERLRCSPRTIYLRLEQEPKLRELLRECRGRLLDLAETGLHRAVAKGEGWAVCFVLKTLGKERGYSTRQEVTGADGAAPTCGVLVVPGTMTKEQWQALGPQPLRGETENQTRPANG